MTDSRKRRCVKCLLQEDIEGHILLDENMVCNLCRQSVSKEKMRWEQLKEIFERKIEENRGKSEYDGVIMMSGGKDSAFLAYTLKKRYNLNVVGIINDIHYEYKETFNNAKQICDELGISLKYNKLPEDMMKKFFKFLFTTKELKDRGCGQICNYCGRLMIRSAGEYASKNKIPMLFSGHNPEQVFGMGQSYEIDKRRTLQKQLLNQMINQSVEKARKILISQKKEELLPYFQLELFPKGVEGLFMYQHFPYEPIKMMDVISKESNWKPIKKLSDTYIASGCRLAHLWIKVASLNKTSNYVDFELSAQVRNGVLSKELVQQFYDNTYDSTEEINELLKDLSIGSINELL